MFFFLIGKNFHIKIIDNFVSENVSLFLKFLMKQKKNQSSQNLTDFRKYQNVFLKCMGSNGIPLFRNFFHKSP